MAMGGSSIRFSSDIGAHCSKVLRNFRDGERGEEGGGGGGGARLRFQVMWVHAWKPTVLTPKCSPVTCNACQWMLEGASLA